VNCSEITYRPRPDAMPETELSTLANAYRFVLDCRAKKGAATSPVSRPNDGTKSKEDSASVILPHQP
jgi:hypothetical protein